MGRAMAVTLYGFRGKSWSCAEGQSADEAAQLPAATHPRLGEVRSTVQLRRNSSSESERFIGIGGVSSRQGKNFPDLEVAIQGLRKQAMAEYQSRLGTLRRCPRLI